MDDQRAGDGRAEQVRSALVRVRSRIEAGCRVAGRSPDGVTLVVVTKTHPAADVLLLAGLGIGDVAENRDQEASAKYDACAADPGAAGLVWHFIGRLQSNKARAVTRYASVVQSVDRLSLVPALGRGAGDHARVVGCLIQVSLDGDTARGGALAADVVPLADAVAGQPGLRLLGVMAVAPLRVEPVRAFAALPVVAAAVRAAHPEAGMISAGMSGDLEAALAAGATHLRVGTAVLGARPVLG